MMQMMLALGGGALLGAVVGQSQALCFGGGGCALTGSWYGGALLGGVIGYSLWDVLRSRKPARAKVEDRRSRD
jgi:hypothetical protein